MLNMFLRWLFFLPVNFFGKLLAYPIVPIVVWFVNVHGRLPWAFRWLETHDNLGWTGLRVEPTVMKRHTWAVEKFGWWVGDRIGLMFWLWRNKAYTLRYKMGMPFFDHKPFDFELIKTWGQEEWPTEGQKFRMYTVLVKVNGKHYFECEPRWRISSKRMIYFRIGWKARSLGRGYVPDWNNPIGSTGMYAGFTPRMDTY